MVWLVRAEPPSLPLVQDSAADDMSAVAFTLVRAAGAFAAVSTGAVGAAV